MTQEINVVSEEIGNIHSQLINECIYKNKQQTKKKTVNNVDIQPWSPNLAPASVLALSCQGKLVLVSGQSATME